MLSCCAYSQVGINTTNPQGIFNIDGAKDNNTTGIPTLAQQANDVVVTAKGNVGIGTSTPTARLDIENGSISPAIKIVDGTEATGYVLTSDSNGNGSWQGVALASRKAVFSSTGVNLSFTYEPGVYYQTGTYIDLDPGNWKVDIFLLLRLQANTVNLTADDFMWLKVSFADSNSSTTITSDCILPSEKASVAFAGPQNLSVGPTRLRNAMLSGTILIKNSSTSVKRYYLIAGDRYTNIGVDGSIKLDRFASTAWGENSIIATSVKLP